MVLVKELPREGEEGGSEGGRLTDLSTDELMKRAAPMMGLGGMGSQSSGAEEERGGVQAGGQAGGQAGEKTSVASPPAPIGRSKKIAVVAPPVPKGRLVQPTTTPTAVTTLTTTTTIPFETLTTLTSDECAARDLDRKILEVYLSKEDFLNVFKMSREAFFYDKKPSHS